MENMNTYKLHQTGPETQTILDQVNENTTDIAQLQDHVNENTTDIAQLQAAYEAITQSEPVIVPPTDTWPVANPQEKVIYRVVDRVNTPPQYYSDYMWNGTEFIKMATYDNAIDDVPTAGSDNLVKSKAVAGELSKLNIFQLQTYYGLYVNNFNTGAISGASADSNGYLVEVLPNKVYYLNDLTFLKYGGSSVQCYSDFPTYAAATSLNLGRAYIIGNGFTTLANTKYIIISVTESADNKMNYIECENSRMKSVINSINQNITGLGNDITDLRNAQAKAESEIQTVSSENVILLLEYAGAYMNNFNIGAITSSVDATHNSYIFPAKPSQEYLYNINNPLFSMGQSIACYSDDPRKVSYTTSFLGLATLGNVNGKGTFITKPNTKYVLIDVDPSQSDGKQQVMLLNNFFRSTISRREVVCYGDSLTQGGNETAGVSYPAKLAQLLGDTWNVHNFGVGGIDSLFIMAVQGCVQIKLIGSNADGSITIPSNGNPVEFEKIRIQHDAENYYDTGIPNNVYLFNAWNNVVIDPYPNQVFAISYNTNTGKPTIRLAGGSLSSDLTTKPYPSVYTISQRNVQYTEDIAILWMGTNGGWNTPEELKEQYKKMIRYNGTRKYLVIGLHATFIPLSTRQAIENTLLAEFGSQFVNIREHLVNYGLDEAGITPTAEDAEAIAQGNVPPSLLVSDGTHFNDAGYNVIGTYIFNRLRWLAFNI